MKTLKKCLTLAIFFIISSFALEVKAQSINYTWDNQSGCDWHISSYDNTGLAYILGTYAPAFSGVGTIPSVGCVGNSSRTPGKFEFVDPNCGCVITINLPTAGTIVTGIVSNCAAQGCSPQCHPTNPTTQISVTPITAIFPCGVTYAIVIQ